MKIFISNIFMQHNIPANVGNSFFYFVYRIPLVKYIKSVSLILFLKFRNNFYLNEIELESCFLKGTFAFLINFW